MGVVELLEKQLEQLELERMEVYYLSKKRIYNALRQGRSQSIRRSKPGNGTESVKKPLF